MTLDWARLTLRLGRFEVLAFGGLVLVLAAAAFAAAARIDSLRPPANCFGVIDVYPPGCESALNTWYAASSGIPSLIAALLLFLSFAAGVFLGVPIVARELERGTTRLAWSLAPSRMRWFLARMVPMLIVLAVVTFTAGVALDRLVAAGAPDQDLANSFIAFGFRGVLIASRAVFIFAVGAVVGAVVGRALPAIILTAVIATIGLAGGERVHQEILQREAVAVPMDPNGNGGRPRRHVHRAEVRASGRHPRRLGVLQRQRSIRRVRQPEVPAGRTRRPRRALPLRRGPRGARAGRRVACGTAAGRFRRVAAATWLIGQNSTGVGGRSVGPMLGVLVTGPRRLRIVTAPNKKTHPATTNSPWTPLIDATTAPAAGPTIPAA